MVTHFVLYDYHIYDTTCNSSFVYIVYGPTVRYVSQNVALREESFSKTVFDRQICNLYLSIHRIYFFGKRNMKRFLKLYIFSVC